MLYLPFRGRIVEWRDQIDDVTEELAIEDLNCTVISRRRPPGIVMPFHYGTSGYRREPRVLDLRTVWLIRPADEVYRDDLAGERIAEYEPALFLYDDHEHLLRDVALRYEPYRVLLELRGGPLRPARSPARQMLTGKVERLAELIALLDAADPRAEVLRRVA